MSVMNIFWRNIKWRFQNPFFIVVTGLQPMLWLVMYSLIAKESMKGIGILNYTSFILPGIIILVSFSVSSGGGFINFLMKTNGSFYRILIAPISRSSIVLGQILETVFCVFFEVAIMFIVSLLFSVKIASGIVGVIFIILIIFMTAFFMASLAYTISLCLPNEVIYETIMNAIVLPLFFLSTALFPVNIISGMLKIIINLNPFSHVINVLRDLILKENVVMTNILPVILLFAVMCSISFMLAVFKLEKETSMT